MGEREVLPAAQAVERMSGAATQPAAEAPAARAAEPLLDSTT